MESYRTSPKFKSRRVTARGKSILSYMKVIIDWLYARNLYVILDFHQDIANEVYGGDGFPDWAIAIDEEHEKPKAPTKPDKKWQFKYMINNP